METRVIQVNVLKVNEDIYGYYFLTTGMCNGILFDHLSEGNYSDYGAYTFRGGNVFMIESNDVDVLYGYYRLQLTESINPYKDIITFQTVAEKISGSLSDNVKFEVKKIEFIYSEKLILSSEGYVDTEGGVPRSVTPSWKFTLYNPNDELTYICYINAKDGEKFRYFTTNG